MAVVSAQGMFQGVMLFGVMAGAAIAQPITPGGVQDTLKKPPTLKAAEPLQAPVSEPVSRPDNSPAALAKKVTVQQFEFAGNTLFSGDALSALVAAYIRRPISLVELYEAADKITEFYVRQGYTLASAVVPAQKINEGTVQLEVIEGRIGKLRYEGLKRYGEDDLAHFLDTAEGRIYRADSFEKNLRTVDSLPGLDVKARLQPGEDYGSSDIVVLASETPLQGSVFVDNGGTQNIGVIRTSAQLTLNNPLGAADQLALTGLRSREGLLKYGSATYSLPTGVAASRVNLTYSYAEFEVSGAFAGVSGSNRSARAELYMPVFDRGSDQLNFIAALNDTRANTDFSGITFNQSEITLLELGGNFTRSYSNRAVTQLGLVLSSNFTGYDANTDAASQPFRLDVDFQQLTPLPRSLQLTTRTQFVYGAEPLPDTQKFSIGGPASVRGYAPSEARGDWGFLTQVSLSRNYLLNAATISPRLFYDAGSVRQHKSGRFPIGSRPQDVALASYGFGTDIRYQQISIKLDYAVPSSNIPVSDGKEDGRFYGTFSFAF